MKEYLREMTEFLKGMLSSDMPQSFARGICAFIIYFKVCESVYIVSKTGVIPDIPSNWWLLISGLYGISKTADTIQTIKKPNDNAVV